MRILVVCGAGASSTFVAQRLRRAAQERGLAWSTSAGTVQSLPIDVDSADVVLVGPHLADQVTEIRSRTRALGTLVVTLPPDAFNDRDGTRTLSLVEAALTAEAAESASDAD